MSSLPSLVRQAIERLGGHQALLLARFIRKLPALWREERCRAQHQGKPWSDNRIFVAGDNAYFPIYCPDDLAADQGSYLRTYNIFTHHANAWYMRREVRNFIRYASKARRFADVGSAEGFYSALFASMHGRNAEILSIDCGSTTGCNPKHSLIVREQNRQVFQPSRWDYLQAFVTDRNLQHPNFPLPSETRIATLSELFRSAGFDPDLIKFDIESSEYEVLIDSLDVLQESRPTLIIEVHNEILEQRQLTFKPVLKRLQDIGYRVVAYDDPDYLKAGNCHVVLQCRS
jgi:hypothetical protein